MHALILAHDVVAGAVKSRSHGFSFTSFYLVRWLWGIFGWWTLAIVGGATFAWSMLKKALGITDDD